MVVYHIIVFCDSGLAFRPNDHGSVSFVMKDGTILPEIFVLFRLPCPADYMPFLTMMFLDPGGRKL